MCDPDSNLNTISRQTSRIDDDDKEEIMDDDDQFIDYIPLNENVSSLSNSNASPTFFMRSLTDACQAAFGQPSIIDRRPVLVYIHRDGNLFQEGFCEKEFYSHAVVDYLNVNYMVWPCDASAELSRFTLTENWEQVFFTKFFDEFSAEEYPLLLGIMRLFEYKTKNGIITTEYQFKIFVKGDILMRTGVAVNDKNLLNELGIFKEECDKQEKDLSFSFINKTGLSWEIVLKIAEYLTLNDAINAFFIDILPLLMDPQAKFQLSNPCDPFIEKILLKIPSEQIVSLKWTTSPMWSEAELGFLSRFREVIFISLRNPQYSDEIRDYRRCFPNLTSLCLYFDNKVDYINLINIIRRFQHQLKRLEIHCPGLFISNISEDRQTYVETVKINAEYFLLDIGHYSSTPKDGIPQDYDSSFYIARAAFMEEKQNIKIIHIIINSDDIKYILDEDRWKDIVKRCPKLRKILIQVLKITSQIERFLTEKARELQTILCNRRKIIEFQISALSF